MKTFTSASIVAFSLVLVFSSCGGSNYSGGGGGGGGSAPAAPTGLAATAGNQQVALTWLASTTASSYHVKRSTTTGGPYTQVASPAVANDADAGLEVGIKYSYVVTAVNSYGESANSSEASATPTAPPVSIHVSVNVLDDRHPISPYVYGGAGPKDLATITDSGLSVVRWGGNGSSTYNWKLFTYNADNDYYFEDFTSGPSWDPDSTKFITDVKAAGSSPLTTMAMLPWVAKGAELASPANNHWSFSVAKYGPQCSVDQYNTDAGNGVVSGTCNNMNPTNLTADPNDAYVPLLDQPGAGDPPGSVYRNQWAAALATSFGSAPHFYDMDNEIDIWGGTHRDIHSAGSGYNELRDVYLQEARNLRAWDPQAIRLGPVSCCWYFYFNLPSSTDNKATHAGDDFLPWWLNEVAWADRIAGSRSLDYFDIHAYPDGPDTSSMTQAQKQALAARIYRDYWDPIYVSESGSINQIYVTQIQPNRTIPFRIPRMRAIVNATYPGTKFAMTEWSAEFAGKADFSTALGDADAYGFLGRERVDLATRWEAPDPANPNYQALKLYRNYDGAHHTFESISVSAAHDADPNLFSSFAAVNAAGTSMTMLLVNKDPNTAVTVALATNGFAPSQVTAYTLSAESPGAIVASPTQAFNSTVTVPKYSVTLFVISGTTANNLATTWDLNPDTVMVPAAGTVTLQPAITAASGTVTLGTPTFDTGITVAVTQGSVSTSTKGAVTVTAGNTPGFYHYVLPGTDNAGVTQNEGGWIVVGKPAATFTKAGDGQAGTHGTTLNLSVTLVPGSSGGTATGASVLFTTDAGSLSSRIVTTNSSGVAAVVLTLPATAGTVHVTAEGPYGLGHPLATFTETSQ